MFISYRKMGQGIAGFVLAAGIIAVAFTSGEGKITEKLPSDDLNMIQQSPGIFQDPKFSLTTVIEDNQRVTTVASSDEVKPTEDFSYTVANGDTLYDLGLKYGVSVEEIQLANKLNTDKLSIDQELIIPVSGDFKQLAALKRATDNNVKNQNSNAAKTKAVKQTASRNTGNNTTVSNIRSGELIAWSEVNKIFPRGATAKVIDVNTGLTFKVKRLQGTYHADSEPVTADDTAILKKIYGGSWSWSRRAVVVEVNGKYIAGSINGMPHGEASIKGNNFAGHICIHFKDSSTHGSSYTKSGTPKTDLEHQTMVLKASGK